jgi:hypothetical protein
MKTWFQNLLFQIQLLYRYSVVRARGTPVSTAVCDALLAELRATQWPVGNARERPKVSAHGGAVHVESSCEPIA